jgi:hypothetical protein
MRANDDPLRKELGMDPPPASRLDLPPIIQCQAIDGRTTDARQAFKVEVVGRPPKMARPALPTGVEEWHSQLCRWVDAGSKGQFLELTTIAAQSQICQ